MKIRNLLGCVAALALVQATLAAVVDLQPQWDTVRILENPDKGWYHHMQYSLSSDADLDNFPGMDHVYLRLSWAKYEPTEGQYNWSWMDNVKNHWVPKGYGFALRIMTNDAGDTYATPQWAIAAGAKGVLLGQWVPDYQDPVFLTKLGNFIRALGQRCDGAPWLRYVDIGIGIWGEGHNSGYCSDPGWPFPDSFLTVTAVKAHIDMYRRAFPRSVLVLSDDAVWNHHRPLDQQQEIRDHCIANRISWRDDGLLCTFAIAGYATTYSIQMPALFDEAWRFAPTVLESEDYGKAIANFSYQVAPNGGTRAQAYFRGAARVTHATYVGYHGNARTWLADNPVIAREMANYFGYWYFPRTVTTPASIAPGSSGVVTVAWSNKGTAPAYRRFAARAKLTGNGRTVVQSLAVSDNRRWMPDSTADECYPVTIAADLPAGVYDLSVGLFDTTVSPERVIEVGLRANQRDAQGYYHLAALSVGQTPVVTTAGRAQARQHLPARSGPGYDFRGRRCTRTGNAGVRVVARATSPGRLLVDLPGSVAAGQTPAPGRSGL